MPPRPSHVTLSQIAVAAGVSTSTVSYALRRHPKIPLETAARIAAVAERLGYRPDPSMAALMAHIRMGRTRAVGERLGFIWMDQTQGVCRHAASLLGARARAEQLGYGMDEFWLAGDEMTARRLAGILRTRGIVGLILAPLHDHASFAIGWDWRYFSPAIIGNAVCTPELHHAGHYHYAGMRTALLKLKERGYRRIAAVIAADINERARRGLSAAFLEHHSTPANAAKCLALHDLESVARDARWLRRLKPDALITTFEILDLLGKAGYVPSADCAVTYLNWQPNGRGYGGVDQCEEIIAANAVDLVVGQLHGNERGAPKVVKMVLSPGIWREPGEGQHVEDHA